MIDVCFHTYPPGWPWTRRARRRFRRRREKIDWSVALRQGFRRHDIKTRLYRPGRPLDADVHVFWGWHEPAMFDRLAQSEGQHALILERGFLPPRRGWASLAFDGLNNHGRYGPAGDNGVRFEQHFGHLWREWQHRDTGRVLLIGQVPGDISLNGVQVDEWAAERAARLHAMGRQVIYRPHPLGFTECPAHAVASADSLAEDMAAVDCVITYSSNTGIEAVLAGVPIIVESDVSMAWPMGGHDIEASIVRPDRGVWAHDLAWKQWQRHELADGTAWDHVRHAVGL